MIGAAVILLGIVGIHPPLRLTERISLGHYSGGESIEQYGHNPDIDTGTVPETIWGVGGTYTWSTAAAIDSISSSDTDDVQDVLIDGLDADWETVEQTVTLQGQTRVALTTPLIRVNGMYNAGAVDLDGTVYVYEDTPLTAGTPDDATKIRGAIVDGDNQLLQCIYTVPAGHTALIYRGYVAMSKKQTAVIEAAWRARLFGGVFRTFGRTTVGSAGNTAFWKVWHFPPAMPEKTDLVIIAEDTTADNSGISCGFELMLLSND
jgi:hypothetical protein